MEKSGLYSGSASAAVLRGTAAIVSGFGAIGSLMSNISQCCYVPGAIPGEQKWHG